MSGLAEAVLSATSNVDPKGYEQYTDTSGESGSAVVCLDGADYTESDLVKAAGLNPDLWCIKGPVNTRRWMRHDQQWLYYFKFDVVQGETKEHKAIDVDQLVKVIHTGTPVQGTSTTSNGAYMVFMSDLQLGKRLRDFGTAHVVARYKSQLDSAIQSFLDLRLMGECGEVWIVGMGDIVEDCTNHYDTQLFQIDLNKRDQVKVARHLITYTIEQFRKYTQQITVACVGGNHGEYRSGGKKITDDADNDDVACFETVKEAYDLAGINLTWHIPQDELSVAHTVSGVPMGFTHGHLGKRGSTAQQKASEWFKGQIYGMQAIKDAKILVTAHYHHFSVVMEGVRTLFQCPANDPGSKWFSDISGNEAPAGLLTFVVDSKHTSGFDHIRVYS